MISHQSIHFCFFFHFFFILSLHKIKSPISKIHEEVVLDNKRAVVNLNRLNITDKMLRCGVNLPKSQCKIRGSDNETASSSTIVSDIEQPSKMVLHSSHQKKEVEACESIEMEVIQITPFTCYFRL